jgi:hypothetical protein
VGGVLLFEGVEQLEVAQDVPALLGEGEVQVGAHVVATVGGQGRSQEAGEAEVLTLFVGEFEEDAGGEVELAFAVVAEEEEFGTVQELGEGRATMRASSAEECG